MNNTIDIFCHVIDNYGDIGVVYRLAKDLRDKHNGKIRVIMNKLDEFVKINPSASITSYQEINNIIYIEEEFFKENFEKFSVADIFIEAFGCNIFDEYIEVAKTKSRLWINLEYLSGEKWIEDVHLMESLTGSSTLKKIFYMPGFSKNSGGLLMDDGFLKRSNHTKNNPKAVLSKYFKDFDFQDKLVGSIFSYEKNFENLIKTLQAQEKETVLLLMGEKTKKSFLEIFEKNYKEDFLNFRKCGKIYLYDVDFLSQEEYEEIISAVDFNFTRGEDSIVRGLLLGKPFLWHIYLQEDMVHMDKLNSFLERFKESIPLTTKEEVLLEKYFKLFRDYNNRNSNSYEKGEEDYNIFFKEFYNIQELCKRYSEFLIENCNLTEKLYKNIKKT